MIIQWLSYDKWGFEGNGVKKEVENSTKDSNGSFLTTEM